MAEQGASVEGGQATEAPAAPSVDLSPVLDQIGQLGERLTGFESQLQQFAPQAEQEEEPGFGFDPAALYGEEEQGVDPQAIQQLFQQMQESFNQQGQATQQEMSQLRALVGDMLVDRTAESLTQAFPKLADPQVAEATVNHARDVARSIGVDESVLQGPQAQAFLTLVIRAQEAEQYAAGETPVGDIRHPSLEGGAGAAPQGRGEGPGIAEQILSAGKAKNSFWGV